MYRIVLQIYRTVLQICIGLKKSHRQTTLQVSVKDSHRKHLQSNNIDNPIRICQTLSYKTYTQVLKVTPIEHIHKQYTYLHSEIGLHFCT